MFKKKNNELEINNDIAILVKEARLKKGLSARKLAELCDISHTEINNIESEKLWEGKSFDKFKENFDEWKLEYLEQLAKMIQLKDFTQSVIDVAEDLIEVRGNLKNSLEV